MERVDSLRRAGFLGLVIGIAIGAIVIALALSVTGTVEAQSFERSDNLKILRRISLGGYKDLVVICDQTNDYAYVVASAGSGTGGISLKLIPNGCAKNPIK